MMDTAIRVLVVDDHSLLRKGLALVIDHTPDLKVVGEGANADQAIELAQSLNPQVILMDLILPDRSGVEAIRAIKSQSPSIQIIALTTFYDEHLIRETLEAGAIGYLLKNVSSDELTQAIRLAASGRSTLSPEAARILIHSTYPLPEADYQLTPREREVLALIAQGLSNHQIAQTLSLSLSTVKKHVGNILDKLNCASRSEAIIFAFQNKLVS